MVALREDRCVMVSLRKNDGKREIEQLEILFTCDSGLDIAAASLLMNE